MRRPVAVLREQRDELARQPGGWKVRRHDAEQRLAILDERRHARRHRRQAGRQVGMGRRERVDEPVQIEQPADVRLRQDEHQESFFNRPSAC